MYMGSKGIDGDRGLRILLVDDNESDIRLITELLQEESALKPELTVCNTLSEASEFITDSPPDVALVDLNLGDSRGMVTFEGLRNANSEVPMIVLTTVADETLGRQAVQSGAQDYIDKNEIGGALLVRAVIYAIERKAIEQQLKRSNARLEERVRERTADLHATIRKNEQEILERRKTEEKLAAEKERLRVILRSIGDAVIATEPDGRIILLNEKAEEHLELSEADTTGQSLQHVVENYVPDSAKYFGDIIEKVVQSGAAYEWPNDIYLKDHKSHPSVVMLSGAPVHGVDRQTLGAVIVLRDVTMQRQREKEIQKADKLDSLGVLAGGISHDFNNILTVVRGNLSLIRLTESMGEKTEEYLSNAEDACKRACILTHQLLTFARGGSPVKKTAAVQSVVKDAAQFASRGSNVKCIYNFGKDLYPVFVDPQQFRQVINNLVLNAIQAMSEGGTVEIAAENVVFREDRKNSMSLPGGKYVKVTVSDTGPGIPPHILPRIYEPYFTTREKGSGLGLASAYSIMRRHGGCLTAQSTAGKGAEFYVWVPAAVEEKQLAEEASDDRTTAVREIKGGRILLMDDEEPIRRLAGQLMSHLGYDIVTVADGVEAIDRYKEALQAGEEFDLVILDLTVPGGMGGEDAFAKLKALNPNVKAIVSSGYSDEPVMSEFRKYGFQAALPKPWSLDEFKNTVSAVIS
ncbi:MAG: response regulator [Lentisphaeria bacterium]